MKCDELHPALPSKHTPLQTRAPPALMRDPQDGVRIPVPTKIALLRPGSDRAAPAQRHAQVQPRACKRLLSVLGQMRCACKIAVLRPLRTLLVPRRTVARKVAQPSDTCPTCPGAAKISTADCCYISGRCYLTPIQCLRCSCHMRKPSRCGWLCACRGMPSPSCCCMLKCVHCCRAWRLYKVCRCCGCQRPCCQAPRIMIYKPYPLPPLSRLLFKSPPHQRCQWLKQRTLPSQDPTPARKRWSCSPLRLLTVHWCVCTHAAPKRPSTGCPCQDAASAARDACTRHCRQCMHAGQSMQVPLRRAMKRRWQPRSDTTPACSRRHHSICLTTQLWLLPCSSQTESP